MTYLIKDWPFGPTSTVYMDGTALYAVRRYGLAGMKQIRLKPEQADWLRSVVLERLAHVVVDAYKAGALDSISDIEGDKDATFEVLHDRALKYLDTLGL